MKQKYLKYYDWTDVSSFIISETGIAEMELWRFWVRYIQDDIHRDSFRTLYIDTLCKYEFASEELQSFMNKLIPALQKLKRMAGYNDVMIRYSF